MINGLIAIFGIMLGFACGYIFGQMRKTEDKTPDMPSPIIAEKKLEVETLYTKCQFPSDFTKEEMIRHLCNSLANKISNESAILLDYYIEKDIEHNVSVARGRIKVVKNT